MLTMKKILICLFLTFFSAFSYSVRINKIIIKGEKIVEERLIRSHLSLKVKQHYRSSKAKKDVRKLFSLGFFDNIEVHSYKTKQGSLNIVYKVKERPLIGEIEFKGNKSLDKEDLEEISEIKILDFLQFDALDKTFQAIKDKYKEKGYFFVNVTHKTSKIKKNKKIKLTIQIRENQKGLIKKISFIGNRHFSSKKLKSFIMTKEQNLMSFLGSSGVYNPENLNKDLQILEYFYRNSGFLNIRVDQPEVSVSHDKKGVYISIPVTEGARLQVGEVGFEGDKTVSAEEVKGQLSLKTGDFFSLDALNRDLTLIASLYKERGYAFARSQPRIYPDQLGAEKVHILLTVNKGKKYTINQVDIKGNHKTRDKVILRRLFIREGKLYKESQKKLTEQLLQQLGFFEKVQIKPIKNKTSNTLDVLVDLEERETTGEAHLAGGYNSYSRLFIKGGIKKNNFLGLDQSISFQVSFNRYQELFNFSYLNPYFLDTDWSLGVDVFNFGQDTLNDQQSNPFAGSDQVFSYSQLNTGFSFSFGRHLNQYFLSSLKYRLQKQSLSAQSLQLFRKIPWVGPVFDVVFGEVNNEEDSVGRVFTFDDIYPLEEGEGINSSLSAIFEYDKRNDRYYASKGYYSRLSLEYSGLGGDFYYTKMEGTARYYKNFFWKMVLKNSLNFGWVFSNKKDKNVPFTELFLLGGPNNLRGFRTNTLGPRRFSERALKYAQDKGFQNPEQFAERPYGGSQMFFYNLELEFPVLERAQMRGAVFFDIGEVTDRLTFDLSKGLRANVGVGLRWKSPFGPINIDLGFPYKPREEYGEKAVELQFGLGSSF